jgi:hypothetical protein
MYLCNQDCYDGAQQIYYSRSNVYQLTDALVALYTATGWIGGDNPLFVPA